MSAIAHLWVPATVDAAPIRRLPGQVHLVRFDGGHFCFEDGAPRGHVPAARKRKRVRLGYLVVFKKEKAGRM